MKFFSAHGGGRGREVCSPASWRCVPRRVSASAKARRPTALSTSGGLGRYWAAQWHLARAVGKRFRVCRAKRLYVHSYVKYGTSEFFCTRSASILRVRLHHKSTPVLRIWIFSSGPQRAKTPVLTLKLTTSSSTQNPKADFGPLGFTLGGSVTRGRITS